jgi:DNA invertase Pin-like site-specific DNA recombinase
VRQSTPQQVSENTESTQRQYALRQRAIDLGWPAERILVIDEDQGRSGASAEGRLGFQRLLAEVGLDHVGLILGLEMSRLARSCRDWHQLLELCGIFRTLLADQDGLYDPTDHNDRLLLGLTGIMSEAELHVLQNRMRQGMLNKARRGELFILPPIGYVKDANGECAAHSTATSHYLPCGCAVTIWIVEQCSLTLFPWRSFSWCATTVIDKCFYQSRRRSNGKTMDHVAAKTQITRNRYADPRND